MLSAFFSYISSLVFEMSGFPKAYDMYLNNDRDMLIKTVKVKNSTLMTES